MECAVGAEEMPIAGYWIDGQERNGRNARVVCGDEDLRLWRGMRSDESGAAAPPYRWRLCWSRRDDADAVEVGDVAGRGGVDVTSSVGLAGDILCNRCERWLRQKIR